MKINHAAVLLLAIINVTHACANNDDPRSFYEHTYIVTFKAANPKDGKTVRDLLDCLHRNMGKAYDKTHHFRTIAGNNELIGKMCVNSKSGITKFINNISRSKEIIFITYTKPSLQQFLDHVKTKQEQLPSKEKR